MKFRSAAIEAEMRFSPQPTYLGRLLPETQPPPGFASHHAVAVLTELFVAIRAGQRTSCKAMAESDNITLVIENVIKLI